MKFTYLHTRFLCLPSLRKAGENCTPNIFKCPYYTKFQVVAKKAVILEATERHRGQFKEPLAPELHINGLELDQGWT